jgi:nitrogen regulatory protein P-II 1
MQLNHKLIVIIVAKGRATRVLGACRECGAEGGTVLPATGTGRSDRRFLGIHIGRDREVMLTLVPSEIVSRVLQNAADAAELGKPGRGIAFVIDAAAAVGIAHLATS